MRVWGLLLAIALSACESSQDSSDLIPPTSGSFVGAIVRVEDRGGYGPVAVALYELSELQIVATTVSDAAGNFAFDELLPGKYSPVVYDEARVVFQNDAARYVVTAGETTHAEIPMTPKDFYANTGVFLEGRVLDSADASPIAGCVVGVVEVSSLASEEVFSELAGRSGPLVDVSDSLGTFRIGPLPVFFIDFGDIQIERVPQVRAYHPLYLAGWIGPWDRGHSPPQEDIRLVRGADTGVISGRLVLLSDGQPAEGLSVAAEWQLGPGGFPKLLLSQVLAISGSDGFFALRGLPPGRFTLLPAALPDDGFVGEFGRTAELQAAGDSIYLELPLRVAPALALLWPENGATPEGQVRFDWEDAAGATQYSLLLSRGTDLASTRRDALAESELIVDGDLTTFLSQGLYFRWSVIAYGPSGEVSRSERPNLLRR